MKEIWKNIEGYEGKYMVSNLGNVKSLWCRNGFRKKERLLKKVIIKNGYARVSLYTKGINNPKIHRLVANAFLGKCPVGLEVRHLNGNKHDNRSENLKYGTRKENVSDAISHGTHGNCNKKTIIQLDSNGNKIKEWVGIKRCIKELDMSFWGIYKCLNGNKKYYKGYQWIRG